ncbi:bud emergence protein 1 [Clydaea vesicula]|uniref:Bud emergence protein 1 n=1 Tax=Clydaea vesicula TaxID=447962 RepID=A0AAD5U1B2_9FUNG|nr:bud emergence protein 1 [Clydaea vesicula]KAJ3380301.1 bud emergence protein 1 [Lobulomyces angularis]
MNYSSFESHYESKKKPDTLSPLQLPARNSSHPTHVFNMAPKRVVRALEDYTAQYAGELSFRKGDFFFVINDDQNSHFEVINPAEKSRGIVPSYLFNQLSNTVEPAHSEQNNDYYDERQAKQTYSNGSYHDDKYYNQNSRSAETSPRSPTTPIIYNKRNTPQTIIKTNVQSVDLKPDGQYWFTVEVTRSDNMRHLLTRKYDDFWILQISLLNFFPIESGRKGRPRTIPFLPPPEKNLSATLAQKRRAQLDVYIQELMSLRKNIKESAPMKRFLMPKQHDVETSLEVEFDQSVTLMDLISGYGESSDVKITLALTNGELINWECPDTVSYNELMYACEDHLGVAIPGLGYMDETSTLLELHGDDDLQLLVKTNTDKLVFYIYDPNYEN